MRTKWIQHNGKQILYSDYTNLTDEQLLVELEHSDALITSQPEDSVLALTNVAGTKATSKALEAYRQSGLKTTPYIRHSVLVGVTGLRRAMVELVTRVTKAQIHICDTLEEGRNWLASRD